MPDIPGEIWEAYGLSRWQPPPEVVHVPSLINRTYVLRSAGLPGLVLQKLHSVFGAQVHQDIARVTRHLSGAGLETPELVPTLLGELYTADASGGIWRALSYIDGVILHSSTDPRCLSSAARLLARFHAALLTLDYDFVHERPIHVTARHLSNLRAALASERGRGDAEAQRLGSEILQDAERVRLDFDAQPRRVVHGDPKLSNVMFDRSDPPLARCMIDLDTVGRGPLAHELGDALRSWCNTRGEDTGAPRLDLGAFSAVFSGYASARAAPIQDAEVLSGVEGLATISLELASRFAADVIQDSYFGWDASRFGSRREHNLVRARGQLALSREVRRMLPQLLEAAERALLEGAAH